MPRSCGERIILDTFFTQSAGDETKWSCKCGKTRTVRPGGGYTNFVQHVQSYHPEKYQRLALELEDGRVPSESASSAATFLIEKRLMKRIVGLTCVSRVFYPSTLEEIFFLQKKIGKRIQFQMSFMSWIV